MCSASILSFGFHEHDNLYYRQLRMDLVLWLKGSEENVILYNSYIRYHKLIMVSEKSRTQIYKTLRIKRWYLVVCSQQDFAVWVYFLNMQQCLEEFLIDLFLTECNYLLIISKRAMHQTLWTNTIMISTLRQWLRHQI